MYLAAYFLITNALFVFCKHVSRYNTFSISIRFTCPGLRLSHHDKPFFYHNMSSECIGVSIQYTMSRTWARNVFKYHNQVKTLCISQPWRLWFPFALPKSTQRHVRNLLKNFKEQDFRRSLYLTVGAYNTIISHVIKAYLRCM